MRLLLSFIPNVRGRPWIAYGLAGPLIALLLFGRPGFLGAIVSFAIYEAMSAPSAGERNRIERYLGGISVSIRFSIGRLMIHLHHWLTMLLLLFIITLLEELLLQIMTRNLLKVLCGCCVGGTAQGLRYSDRFRVVRRRQLSISLSRRQSIDEDIIVENQDEDFIDIELFSDEDELETLNDSEMDKGSVQFHVDLFGCEACADMSLRSNNSRCHHHQCESSESSPLINELPCIKV